MARARDGGRGQGRAYDHCRNACAILAGERVALHLSRHLSGIATATAAFVGRVAYNTRVTCTLQDDARLRACRNTPLRA